jgi:hypothetical protein
MVTVFNGGKLFVDVMPLVTVFGFSLAGDPAESDLLAAAGNWTIVAASDRGDRRWSVAARGEVMAAGQRRD